MKSFIALCVLGCLFGAAFGRQLQQAPAAASGGLTAALQQAAASAPQLSTLVAAIQASGLQIPDDAAWTIFAPTNEAFADDDVREETGLTAHQLLEPANRDALVQLLSYHVVPAGAVSSSQLTEGQVLQTLLEGATLKVDLDEDDGRREIEIEATAGDDDGADVVTADIVAGNSIIHVVDDVLIPAALRRSG
uniref:Astaxanthin-binding pink protein of fasciclin family n=1 Tax=Scenedesmus sp. Oki-4N TaxID=2650458 RepID=A0A7G1GET6_9CHLO|nr:astaxanthin-binding pink protein of fasciclin family [Scenedesmus sp. Oki-4N]